MTQLTSDPLLTIARFLLTAGLVIVAIAGIAIAIAVPVLFVFHATVTAQLAAEGAPAEIYWAIIGVLALVSAMLAMIFVFIRELRRIVGTVADGDPFVPVNALRLTRMAWLALGVWALNLPVQAIGAWIDSMTEDGSVQIGFGEDGVSLILVLTLFILARVFTKGAEMREDLEGTV